MEKWSVLPELPIISRVSAAVGLGGVSLHCVLGKTPQGQPHIPLFTAKAKDMWSKLTDHEISNSGYHHWSGWTGFTTSCKPVCTRNDLVT